MIEMYELRRFFVAGGVEKRCFLVQGVKMNRIVKGTPSLPRVLVYASRSYGSTYGIQALPRSSSSPPCWA